MAGDLGAPPHLVSVMLGHLSVDELLLAGYKQSNHSFERRQIPQKIADKLEVLEGGKK